MQSDIKHFSPEGLPVPTTNTQLLDASRATLNSAVHSSVLFALLSIPYQRYDKLYLFVIILE